MTPKEIVERFWKVMESNDFRAAAEMLHEEYRLLWPQSGERVEGRENFAEINTNYPAEGKWRFTVNSIVAEGDRVVSDVSVTDGSIEARAITFSTVRDGKIAEQVEFWPDPFEPQPWRARWVKREG
jgi:ketosteroid isomerase-like protein